MIFIILLLITVITIYLYFLLKYKRRLELGYKLPGPKFIPLLGSAQFITLKAEKIFEKLNELSKLYKDCFTLWLGPNLWIFLHNPEHIEKVLNIDMIRPDGFYLLKPLIGDGLLLSTGKKWFIRRKVATPAFNIRILEDFLPIFSRQADILVNKLKQVDSIEISSDILLCVLDTMCESWMGVEINAQINTDCIYIKSFHEYVSHILFKQMANPLLKFDFIFHRMKDYTTVKTAIETIHKLTEKVIDDKRRNFKLDTPIEDEFGRKRKQALLDVLLQTTIDGEQFTNEEIKDEVNTFLFAGIDTTKSATCFLLYNLSKYEDIQQKVIEEIWSVVGKDPKQEITPECINKLKYLDMVLKESMRFHTTVPLTGRKNIKEIQLGDFIVPKDSSLWINIYAMCHDPKFFPNPEKFIPDRFDGSYKISSYIYIPFSAGLHTCIGRKFSMLIIKTIAIKILLNYRISLCFPDEKLELLSEMVLKSKTGFNLKFKERY